MHFSNVRGRPWSKVSRGERGVIPKRVLFSVYITKRHIIKRRHEGKLPIKGRSVWDFDNLDFIRDVSL